MLLPLFTYLFFNHGAPSIDQNGQWPAYNSTKFTKFCELWKLITPQELLIIHKAKPLLNMLIVLLKNKQKKTQKWGDNKDPPQVQLPKALFILNFLNSFGSNTEPHLGRTAAERHFNNLHSPKALEKVPFGGKIFKLINGS